MESTIDPVVLTTAALNHEQKCEMCMSLIKILYTRYIFNFPILAVLDKIIDQIIIHCHTLMIWHDDVIKWKHFPRYRPFVRAIHRWPVNFPHKGQWRGALMFSLICDRINGWVNSREAGDLRRHPAHYDVIVMDWLDSITQDVCIFEYVNKTTPVYVLRFVCILWHFSLTWLWIFKVSTKSAWLSLHTLFAMATKQSIRAYHIDGWVQERRNSSALTMELRLSCINPSIYLR